MCVCVFVCVQEPEEEADEATEPSIKRRSLLESLSLPVPILTLDGSSRAAAAGEDASHLASPLPRTPQGGGQGEASASPSVSPPTDASTPHSPSSILQSIRSRRSKSRDKNKATKNKGAWMGRNPVITRGLIYGHFHCVTCVDVEKAVLWSGE